MGAAHNQPRNDNQGHQVRPRPGPAGMYDPGIKANFGYSDATRVAPVGAIR
jgi:hypothetical protein